MIAIISLPELGNCHTLKASNSSTLNYVAFFLFSVRQVIVMLILMCLSWSCSSFHCVSSELIMVMFLALYFLESPL